MNLILIAVLAILFAARQRLADNFVNSVFAKWKWNPNFWNGKLSSEHDTIFGMYIDGPRLVGLLFVATMLVSFNLMHYDFFAHVLFKSFFKDVVGSFVMWEIIYLFFYNRVLAWKNPGVPPPAPVAPKTSL